LPQQWSLKGGRNIASVKIQINPNGTIRQPPEAPSAKKMGATINTR
jgi:hypothetical protein